jgi:MerT mercuric transport protein
MHRPAMDGKGKSNFAAIGAVSGSLGLSGVAAALGLCCYGPLVATLVGVTGAAWISRLGPYRPVVLIAAGGLLAWAFWRVYSRPQPGLAIQIISWTSLALFVASVFLPDLAELFIVPDQREAHG